MVLFWHVRNDGNVAFVHALPWLTGLGHPDLLLEHFHIVADSLQVNLLDLDPLHRILNLFLELLNLRVLVFSLHPSQLNMALVLLVVFFAFQFLCLLAVYL